MNSPWDRIRSYLARFMLDREEIEASDERLKRALARTRLAMEADDAELRAAGVEMGSTAMSPRPYILRDHSGESMERLREEIRRGLRQHVDPDGTLVIHQVEIETRIVALDYGQDHGPHPRPLLTKVVEPPPHS